MKKLFSRFTQGALILTITTFFSYLAGLARDRIFAHTFGAGITLDMYNASFAVPDLLLNILVMSALAGGFVPIFTGLLAQEKKEEAYRVANTMIHAGVFVIFLTGILAAIFMPALSKIIAPGFSPENLVKLTSLSRLMLISPVILAVSNTLGSILIGYKRFLAYGLSPIFYNLGIIAGAVLLYPFFGAYGLVMGTLVGGLIHLAPRIVDLVRSPFRYSLSLHVGDRNFLKLIRLTIVKMFGQPVEQITFIAFNSIATKLAAGSLSAVSFARNFQSAGVALFGIAFSVAVFPMLSEAAAQQSPDAFLQHFKKALKDILIFTVPIAIGLYFLSDLPIRIFLGGGKFSDENIFRTASVLSVFALSIPTESLVHLLARSFYALKNTLTPVLLSIFGFCIAASFAYLKAPIIGITAIPYGFFLGSLTEVLLLILFLRPKLRK